MSLPTIRDESARRQFLDVLLALPPEERTEAIALAKQVVSFLETTERVPVVPGPATRSGTYTDKTLTFLKAGKGSTIAEVSRATGQPRPGCQGTLHALKTRGLVERQGHLWVATGDDAELVIDIFKNEKCPLSLAELNHLAQEIQPGATLDCTVSMMVRRLWLVEVGNGADGQTFSPVGADRKAMFVNGGGDM